MGQLLSEPVTAIVLEKASSSFCSASVASMQGWRRSHEDSHIFQCSTEGPEDSAVFAVLDGHGGSTAASLSSSLLEERMRAFARRGTLDDSAAAEALCKEFIEADAVLRERLGPGDGSGSTVVAAVITRPGPAEFCVRIANCGDSRAVLRAGGSLIATEDHKPGREDEAARITAAGGTVAPGVLGGPLRVDGSLAVSRAMGDFGFKPEGQRPEACRVTALPEVQTVRCAPGDWLVLACDGIFDVFGNEELQEFVEARLAGRGPEDVGDVADDLIRASLQRGSKDNCTALFVRFTSSGTAVPHRRELLQGDCQDAAPEIKAKYAEWFESQGFPAEARALLGGSRGSSPKRSTGGPGRASGPAGSIVTGGPPPPPQNVSALAKALQAMKSTRAIQRAWRSRQEGSG